MSGLWSHSLRFRVMVRVRVVRAVRVVMVIRVARVARVVMVVRVARVARAARVFRVVGLVRVVRVVVVVIAIRVVTGQGLHVMACLSLLMLSDLKSSSQIPKWVLSCQDS